MSRLVERLVDLVATLALMGFAWLLRLEQPALAGAVVVAAVQFWLSKNAKPPENGSRGHPAEGLEP